MEVHDISDGSLRISDVIEVIEKDPEFADVSERETQLPVEMNTAPLVPYVEIVEQPASKALRFRYICEGRSAGSIPGVNSTPENKTFPSIRIVGYKGRAVAVVSCVTKDEPYRAHPHNLVGKSDACNDGVCTVEVSSENMTATFANLGIQCVTKKEIEKSLRTREEMRVDPFQNGFEHRRHPTTIDLNAVRLCFQVFVEGSQKKLNLPLKPIISDPIYDKKAMSDLVICKLSHCSASVAGGMEMILLCEKVAKEDIKVRFFEEKDKQVVWDKFADFQPANVHKQTAIAFRTPSYYMQQVEQPVQVYIQLYRPSDYATSEPLPFQLLPLGADDPDSLRRKRKKYNNSPNTLLRLQTEAQRSAVVLNQPYEYHFNIKAEPNDRISPYGGLVAAGPFPSYPMGATFPQTQSNVQILKPQSQGRTPSPLEYSSPYNPATAQSQSPQYHQPPPESHVQPFPYIPNMLQVEQPQEHLMLSRVSPVNYQNDYQSLNSAGGAEGTEVRSVLDMDTHQCSNTNLNQLNSAEIICALLGTNHISENLSSLSFSDNSSDSVKPEMSEGANSGLSNVEESNASMTDSFTRIANDTIQGLSNLNNMYK